MFKLNVCLVIFLLILLYCSKNSAKKNNMKKYKYFHVNQCKNDPFLIILTNNTARETRDLLLEEMVVPVEGTCTNQVLNNILEMKKQHGCQARLTPVNLRTENNLPIEPIMVFVKRCQGICNTKLTCEPSRTIQKKINLKQFVNGAMKCFTVEVAEHTQCKCKCVQTEKDCVGNQSYNPRTCSCYCKNDSKRQEICYRKKFEYDYKRCSCNCPKKSCTTGEQWSEEKCRCVLVRNALNYKRNFYKL